MTQRKFKDELGRIAYSVSVVTVGHGGLENGLTVSWLSQVSFDPPMIMFAIDANHYSAELIEDMPSFVVNLLGQGQRELAAHFARRSMTDQPKIDAFPTRQSAGGLAILTDAVAYYECDVVERHRAGDHWIVVGQVTGADILNDDAPMTSLEGMRYTK